MSQTTTDEPGRPRRAGAVPVRSSRRVGVALFLRQVIAELHKVVRPTRTELITYTSVVMVFVVAVMAYVTVLDAAFGKLVLWVFSGGGS